MSSRTRCAVAAWSAYGLFTLLQSAVVPLLSKCLERNRWKSVISGLLAVAFVLLTWGSALSGISKGAAVWHSNWWQMAGPNMAGKSTILRSVCAVALLSSCGLYAPVQRAVIPYTDAFMLRNFSADSPLEGKSSFAVEMVEMRYYSAVLVIAQLSNVK